MVPVDKCYQLKGTEDEHSLIFLGGVPTRANHRLISSWSEQWVHMFHWVPGWYNGPLNSILHPHPVLTLSLQKYVISEGVAVLVPWTFEQTYISSPFFWGEGTCEEAKSLLALKGKNAHIMKMEYNKHLNDSCMIIYKRQFMNLNER